KALENNLGLLLQEETEATAQGTRWRELADLLPHVSGALSRRRQESHLPDCGFPAKPSIVGPFNVYDARVYFSQAVVDVEALNQKRAGTLTPPAEKERVTH